MSSTEAFPLKKSLAIHLAAHWIAIPAPKRLCPDGKWTAEAVAYMMNNMRPATNERLIKWCQEAIDQCAS